MEAEMRHFFMPAMLAILFLAGCAASDNAGTIPSDGRIELEQGAPGGGANAFNPYMNSRLPNTRQLSAEGQKMLGAMGGRAQSIEGEAAHRKNWRDEIYPVLFGDKRAPHEIIAILDFSSPKSEEVWKSVVEASKSLSPAQCKIVVYGRSRENYGTDLMGFAIWLAHSRPGQAMPYLSHALAKWNEVKAAQKKSGTLKNFTNEYDATATAQDYPIHYGYLMRVNPPIPPSQQMAVAKYCYDAGNVNMYQAMQVCRYYGVSSVPIVIVDGRRLSRVTAKTILEALK